MRPVYIIFLAFFSGACMVKKPSSGERSLFMEPNSNAVTLINTIPLNQTGGRHVCMMMASRNAAGRQFINYYLSDWTAIDTSFRWQVHYAGNLQFDDTRTFPIVTIPDVRDTLNREWYWSMDRSKMKLEAKWKDEGAANYRFNYTVNDSFRVREVDKQNRIAAIDPIQGMLRADGTSRHGEPVSIYISVIHDFDSLLKRFKGQTLVWIDGQLTGYGHVKTLQAIQPSGSMQTVFFMRDTEMERSWHLSEPFYYWKSKTTGRSYPLMFKLVSDVAATEFSIEPFCFDQEINRKTSSFWMGAIAIKEKGRHIGKGNMYVFSIK